MVDVLIRRGRHARKRRQARSARYADPVRLLCMSEGVVWPFWIEDRFRRCVQGLRRTDCRASQLTVVKPPLLSIRTGRRKPRLDGVVADEVFIVGFFRVDVGGPFPNFSLASLVNIMADLVTHGLVYYVDRALESGIDWPMIRELQGCGVVSQLSQVGALTKDTVRPSWDPCFVTGGGQSHLSIG